MITIGNAVSMNDPQNETIIPDDRQTLLQTMQGVVVQDYGHVSDGDKISMTLQFSPSNWAVIRDYWNNRVIVNVTDAVGNTTTARVIVKQYSYVVRFRRYVNATIELWRV